MRSLGGCSRKDVTKANANVVTYSMVSSDCRVAVKDEICLVESYRSRKQLEGLVVDSSTATLVFEDEKTDERRGGKLLTERSLHR